MRGSLSEIDIRSILQLIELGQRTGLLFVEADIYRNHNNPCHAPNSPTYNHKQRSWFMFFLNGRITYATHGKDGLPYLDDYLYRYHVNVKPDEMQLASMESLTAPDYGCLWLLLEKNILNPAQARNIIHSLVQEILFDLLSLHEGNFIFELGMILTPQLTSIEIAPLMTRTVKQVQEWKQLHPHIQSPDQFPVLADMTQLNSSLPPATVTKLQRWLDGKTSLRQLSRYLNRDILTVAKAIYPYVQQGWLQLVNSVTAGYVDYTPNIQSQPERDTQVRIVCIDDATALCQTVEAILQPKGYEIISFTNSLEALSLVFQLKPNLILCDISMPQLDGYELCTMLKHSTVFRLVPIIMLTGKVGFIDRVRATMMGATDYLTKPFEETELLMLVEKYAHSNALGRDKVNTRLVDCVKDEVKNIIT